MTVAQFIILNAFLVFYTITIIAKMEPEFPCIQVSCLVTTMKVLAFKCSALIGED